MKFIVDSGRQHLEFPLKEGVTIVGRDPGCDIVLDHPKVSRRHMECIVTGKEARIKDLGSRNGTFVGDVQVSECKLNHGDVIRLGTEIQLIFDQGTIADSPTVAVPPPAAQEPLKNVPTRPGADDADAEDEPTPHDETLLPAQYQPTVAGEARVVERDGRWYAVDPATGREVEIQPVGYPPSPAAKGSLVGRFAALRPPVKIAIVVCLLVIVLTLAAGLASRAGGGKKPQGQGGKRMSRAQYMQMVEDAVAKLSANNVVGAEDLLNRARRALPNLRAADALLDVCKIWIDLKGKNFRATRDEAEELFEEIADADYAPQKARIFARKQLQWLHEENQNEAILFNGKRFAKRKEWDKAFRCLERIPKDSLCYPEAKALIAKVKQTIVSDALEAGDRAYASQDWDAAAQAYARVLEYQPDYPDLKKKISECRRNAVDKKKLADALAAKGKGDWDQVRLLADAIRPDGPYGAEAAELKKLVAAKSVCAEAQALYDAGDAQAAIAKLNASQSPEAKRLAAHIQAVLSSLKAGDEAAAQKDFTQAVARWQDAARLEQNKENFYRREAERKIQSWKEQAARVAQDLVSKGMKAYQEGKYDQARDFFEKAKQMDPEGQAGVMPIREMLKVAENLYYRAYAMRGSRPDEAKKLFLKVKSMTKPGDELYAKAVLELSKLQTREP